MSIKIEDKDGECLRRLCRSPVVLISGQSPRCSKLSEKTASLLCTLFSTKRLYRIYQHQQTMQGAHQSNNESELVRSSSSS
ncbi:hypothetical protein V5799_025932 [Amblyomma americanum]|uniref:Uncharacterized protein n=1 Tax=Amblyomma americanum TaxID=6943 RepID=A0AAQ4DK21_AMBAM